MIQHDKLMIIRTPFAENTMDRLALLSAWLFSLIIVLYPILDFDMYWHLANGREMIQSGRIISEEVFSYTHFGEKFENHEWLAQIILYIIWQAMGSYGLLCLKLLITSLVVLLGYRTARFLGSQPWLASLLCVFGVLAGFDRYSERPELFSLFNVALISFILYGYRAGRLSRKMLWLIPPILMVWNSLHGAVYGLVFLSVFVAGENIKHFFPALSRDATDDRTMLSALNLCYALTMFAMLIDPFGLRSYGIFFRILGNEGNALTKIAEFMPITAFWRDFTAFIFLLIWGIMLAVRHIRRIDITQLILLLVFGVLAIKYSRAAGVASIVLIPIIASLMVITAQQAVSRLQQTQATVIMLVATIFVASYGYVVKFVHKSDRSFGYHLDESYFPTGAVRFIQAMELSGNYYNTGHFGGFLSLFLAPERKIFQYNLPAVFGDTYRFVNQPDELVRWNLNYAIVGNPPEISILFPAYQWARIYRDPGAVLVLRRTPQNQALIQQYELHFFHPLIQDDVLRRQAEDAGILPRLAEEMGIYLAFRKDQRIAEFWAEILAANPNLRNQPRIQQLLQQALKYNKDGKLTQLAG